MLPINVLIIINMNKKWVLVLGGCGYIGTNICEDLLKNRFNVIAYDLNPGQSGSFLELYPNSYKHIQGVVSDLPTLVQVVTEHQIMLVMHLVSTMVPSSGYDKYLEEQKNIIVPSIELIKTFTDLGVNKLMFFSSGGTIYGNNGNSVNSELSSCQPINYYGLAKQQLENYLLMNHESLGLDYLIIRPSNPYGKNKKISSLQGLIPLVMSKLKNNQIIEVWGDGESTRDYIYIDDLAALITEIIKKNTWNEIYNIGTGEGTSINQIIEIAKAVTSKDVLVEYIEARSVDVPKNVLNINKLEGLIGKHQLLSVKQGMKLLWKAMAN